MSTLIILALIVGFIMALAIGANDVANSMATAVGAKAITIKQAVVIAGILEFTGAFIFGKSVTETIRKGIVNINLIHEPKVVVAGAFAALLSAIIWIFLSTAFSLPVSTTHSIVGGMAGFGLVALGIKAVNWAKMCFIVASWVLSPFLGGIIAFLMFRFIVKTILHNDNPIEAVKKIGPGLIGITFLIIGMMFFVKVLHRKNLFVDFIYAIPIAIVAYIVGKILITKVVFKEQNRYFEKVEKIFKNLQVMTSCYVSLAHGSNDVANAIGPLAAIYVVVQTGVVSGKVSFPRWLLALGGIGISIGVALWGYRVMKTVGDKITELTNTRGFSIDFATATTVLLASMFGLPVSSTHTVVGAVVGVGYARGIEALNFNVLKQIIISWLLTVPIAALTSAIIFLQIKKFIVL